MPDSPPDNFDPQGERRKRDELLLLAILSMDDLDDAVAFWRQHAPVAYAGILERDGWEWDEDRQVYVSDSGTTLDGADMKRLSIIFATASEVHELEPLARHMAEGDMDIDQWETAAASLLKDLYLALAIFAVGGVEKFTEDDLKTVEGSIESESGLKYGMDRLDHFAEQVQEHEAGADSVDAVVNRSGLYASAAAGVYERSRQGSHLRAEDEEGNPIFAVYRNVLGETEAHCSECPDITAQGWQPIGTLPEIGTRQCMAKCKCSWEFSLHGGDSL